MCSAPLCFALRPFEIHRNTPGCCIPGDADECARREAAVQGLGSPRGPRRPTGGLASGAEPTWMGQAFGWLHDCGTLVFASAFRQRASYPPGRLVMVTQEEKGSKAGEPKWPGCPPHLLSEIAAPRAVAKPAANHWSRPPGVEKRCGCRSGCSNASGCGNAAGCCPARALRRGNLWERGGGGKTFCFNLPAFASHCPQPLLLLLSSRNASARF